MAWKGRSVKTPKEKDVIYVPTRYRVVWRLSDGVPKKKLPKSGWKYLMRKKKA